MKAVWIALALFTVSGAAAIASGYSEFVSGLSLWRDADDQAIVHFTAALADPALAPDLRAVAYFDRGETYMRQSRFEMAIADFSASLAIRQDFDAYIRRGAIYAAEGKTDPALADVTAAIALRPNFPLGYHFRGEIHVQARDFKAALADADAMVRLAPDDIEGYEERSVAHRYLGEYSAAIDDAEHVVHSTDGASLAAYIDEAAAYEDRGDLREALHELDEGLRAEPKSAVTLLTRGVVLWELKRYAEAERAFLQSLDVLPDDGYAVLWLAIARADGHLANTDFATYAAQVDAKSWPSALVRYYQGKEDIAAALAEARSAPFDGPGYVCEAHFYDAEFQRIQGHGEAERPALQGLPESCPPGLVEARVAAHILKGAP